MRWMVTGSVAVPEMVTVAVLVAGAAPDVLRYAGLSAGETVWRAGALWDETGVWPGALFWPGGLFGVCMG